MFMINIFFMIQWSFLFLISWNIKNQAFNDFLKIYSFLICKTKFLEREDEADQSETKSVRKPTKSNKKGKILAKKSKNVVKSKRTNRKILKLEDEKQKVEEDDDPHVQGNKIMQPYSQKGMKKTKLLNQEILGLDII